MELALGTVQFGLPYGVAGRGTAVPEAEVRNILARAWERGIRWLDTASAYGDIEPRLQGLAGTHGFSVVTKLPALPAGLAPDAVDGWAHQALERAQQHLGSLLSAVLLHRADDLLEAHADALWSACARFAAERAIPLGVSCYDTATLTQVCARFPVALAQLPGNALDQRLHGFAAPYKAVPAIHLRSAFLQGLLLLPEAAAAARVPAAAAALARWHAWCRAQALPPLVAALGLVKAMPGVSHCVVGVDNLAQLDAIADAWQAAPVLQAPELRVDALAVIDPRHWPPLKAA